ncbi:MAG: heavy metal-binding domain-containing protein [Candidatus Neomarinimicrobiota bacterium]
MNKKLIVIGLIVLSGIWACGKTKTADTAAKMDHSKMAMAGAVVDGEQLIYYTCPMDSHKHVHSMEPGKCPECSMTLVAGVVTTEAKMDYYGCPMEVHSHIRSDQPGTCDECGMLLKPMRLVKG